METIGELEAQAREVVNDKDSFAVHVLTTHENGGTVADWLNVIDCDKFIENIAEAERDYKRLGEKRAMEKYAHDLHAEDLRMTACIIASLSRNGEFKNGIIEPVEHKAIQEMLERLLRAVIGVSLSRKSTEFGCEYPCSMDPSLSATEKWDVKNVLLNLETTERA